MTSRTNPLRLAYARTLQAILAVAVTRLDVDPSLGGSEAHLDAIESALHMARDLIVRLAVAERINLGEQDEE